MVISKNRGSGGKHLRTSFGRATAEAVGWGGGGLDCSGA